MASITIDGNTYQGNSISVINGVVYIDNASVFENSTRGAVNLEVSIVGNLESLKADNNVTVHGDVNGNTSAGNNLKCLNIQGSATAGNNINCENIGGSATAGNNIIRS